MVRTALLIGLSAIVIAAPAQTFKISATAFDEKTGRVLEGLRPENLQVADGDTLLRVERVERRSGPLDVMLLIDTSIVGQAVQSLIAPMIGALEEGEQMALVGFDQSATLLHDFTSSAQALLDAAQTARYGNNPRVIDALFAALDGGFEHTVGRRAAIVLSAGVEGRSKTGLADIHRLARRRGVALYMVYVEGADSRLFEKVALGAGGAYFHAKKLKLKPEELARTVFAAARLDYELSVSGVRTLSDRLEAEIVDWPDSKAKPAVGVLALE